MNTPADREELVRIYRDTEKSEDVIIEVLGEPVVALKQMKAEPWTLREQAEGDADVSEKG